MLSASLSSGVKLVQLRAKSMDATAYSRLAEEALRVCQSNHARLILNGPIVNPNSIKADGVHLSSARLMACAVRPLAGTKLVSAACHSLNELTHAECIGLDFVTLSPVLPTTSHPGTEPIGWERFAELAASVRIPVYALGGMKKTDVSLAKSHGACGIAAIRDLW
jgi:thiamine-phosphate pyrophosphorylase